MIELIKETAIENINVIILYSLAMTVVAIVAVVNRRKKFAKYRIWKKDTISILGFKREWESTEDIVLQQLWDENQRLDARVQVLSKKYNSLSIRAFVLGVLVIIWVYLVYIFRIKKK